MLGWTGAEAEWISSNQHRSRMLTSPAVGGSCRLSNRGKFLYEIKHVNFMTAAEGILGGVLLMLLGAGLGMAGKASARKQ
jgi:hypothetical protein